MYIYIFFEGEIFYGVNNCATQCGVVREHLNVKT